MASSAISKLYLTVRDAVGRNAHTAIQLALDAWNPGAAPASTFKALVTEVLNSGAVIDLFTSITGTPYTHAFTAAPRCTREDKITIVLPDDNNVDHVFKIPTPSTALSAVLGSDKLNTANVNVLSWVSQMAAHALTPDGIAFKGTVTGGRYIKHKAEKKGGF
jgi:hypothetical protein